MVFTRLSRKHQTTISAEAVKQLGLAAGVRFRQWVEGNRIIMEPMPDAMSIFGSLRKRANEDSNSIELETQAAEIAVASEAAGSRDEF